MPELPEVETVVRGLRRRLPGRRILSVWLGKTDFIEEPGLLAERLERARVKSVHRHGKFVVIEVLRDRGLNSRDSRGEAAIGKSSCYLLVHLGMTGQLTIRKSQEPTKPHTHVVMRLDDGMELRYVDARRFGRIQFHSGGLETSRLGKLGAEPLKTSKEEFSNRIRGRRTQIKALLLDQRVLRGMGNIYTDESLWRGRIHPARRGTSLTEDELRRLHIAMREVLMDAIRSRGSTIADYVDSLGNRGAYQQRHVAYGREGKSCLRCGKKIERIIVAGRSSFFCPKCQRAPRRPNGAHRSKTKTAMRPGKHGKGSSSGRAR